MFNITILSDKNSWINKYIPQLINDLETKHQVFWCHDFIDIPNGDIAIFLGCYSIVNKQILAKNTNNIVVHASDLPKGRGWAPLTWQILEGKNKIPVVLFEAVEEMDAGVVYIKDHIEFDGTELCNKIREKQAENAIKLTKKFVSEYPDILKKGISQKGMPTFYKKRTSESSELDINKTIKEQFNLFRIVDNNDYPAFFIFKNKKYIIKIEEKNL